MSPILTVLHSVVSPTLNASPTLFVIPCFYSFILFLRGGILDLECCNDRHLPVNFAPKFNHP